MQPAHKVESFLYIAKIGCKYFKFLHLCSWVKLAYNVLFSCCFRIWNQDDLSCIKQIEEDLPFPTIKTGFFLEFKLEQFRSWMCGRTCLCCTNLHICRLFYSTFLHLRPSILELRKLSFSLKYFLKVLSQRFLSAISSQGSSKKQNQ